MNKIYKIIWSKARNCYVVVSELARRNAKGSGSRSRRVMASRVLGTLIVSAYLAGCCGVPVASAEGELHYYSVKSDSTGSDSNYNNNGATGTNTIAIGPNASAISEGSLAIGIGVTANDKSGWGHVVAIGSGSSATGSYAIALGHGAIAGVSAGLGSGETIAIGDKANAAYDWGIAIGANAAVGGEYGVAIGNSAIIGNSDTIISYGTSIGNHSNVSSIYGTALGSGAEAKAEKGVAIGYSSVAERAAGVAGYDPSTRTSSVKTTLPWKSTAGAVSVGSSAYTRQITGVAAGSEDTDAVNVAQLKAAMEAGGGGGAAYTAGSGISIDTEDNNKISVNNGAGLIVDSDNKLAVNTGAGLSVADNKIKVNAGDGLEFDSGALKVKSGEIASDSEGFAKAAAVYTEVRPSDGNYVKKAFSAATNMAILDTQLKQTTNALKTEVAERKTADTELSDRIGTLDADGNYTKSDNSVTQNLTALDTAVTGKADKATTLKGYGISDAYTKTEVDTAVNAKANKATTLEGYGITDAYTKNEADNKFLTQASIENKADKSTTLAGYGIKNAYTKTETTAAINTAVAGKADKATTLEGYGITDAYTKTATDNAIGKAVVNKADKATTLAGYGITDAYTKTEADSTFLTQASIKNKADKATTLAGYGITDAYTKDETNSTITTAVAKKADRATTLEGYGITDAYTQEQTNSAIKAAAEIKADKATTLAGYGITDAYTQSETNTAITTAVTKKADRATTLAGYGITDAYTQAQTNNAISTAVAGKADAATTLEGYGIRDAYTKTESDSTFVTKTSLDNKADKASTLAGYGITNAYTKTETTSAINEAIAVKADKATTLAGYGITNAYTKTEADAAHTALSDRIGTIAENGIIIEADKNIAYNLTKVDTALKGATTKLQELFDTKASVDASNIGLTAENRAAWGAKLGGGTVKDGDNGLVTGGAVYSEVRPADGVFVKLGNTTAQNLTALDSTLGEVKKSSDNIIKELQLIEAVTDISFDAIVDIADEINQRTQEIETIKDMDGLVAPKGSSKADEFVRGVTVYNEVRPADGTYVKKDNTTAENLTALDKQAKANADNIGLKANAADVYTKTAADDRFALKADTLQGYGITDAYTKTEVDNAVGEKADRATTLQGYGIADAYTKTEIDNVVGAKADKATTLQGYGIVDTYTKTEVDNAIGRKADKATTLQGYGITDAYTKTEADNKFLTQASIDNKADKASTLAGYGITDAFTKEETTSAISSAVSGKADKATTLQGYGITDAYTKTEADNKFLTQASIDNKVDKATTLSGYGITDAFTKEETTTAISTAVANKANKAATLEGYGITDAYTKTETDIALNNRIGVINKDGLVIKADKNVSENLTLIDNAIQKQTGIAKEILDKKANADASNVGKNAKAGDGSSEDNSAAWGSALGSGAVESGNGKLVTGATVYNEVRTQSDGEYVKMANTAGANLIVLDTQMKTNTDAIEDNAAKIETNTTQIAETQKDVKDTIGAISYLATIIGVAEELDYEKIVVIDKKMEEMQTATQHISADENGTVISGATKIDGTLEAGGTTVSRLKVNGTDVTDALTTEGSVADGSSGFVKGDTVYDYLNQDSLELGKSSTKVAIGKGSSAGTDSVAIGTGSTATGSQNVAIGSGNSVTGDQNVVIGTGHSVNGNSNIAIGDPHTINGSNSGGIGNGVTINGNDTFVIGNGTVGNAITGNGSFVLGNNVQGNASNSVILGSNVNVTTPIANAVVLGDGSTAEDGAVSVGSAGGGERQIKHVADGRDDHDAATVGQLQAASQTAYNNAVYLNNSINRVDSKVNKVGAGAAALAALHPMDMDGKLGMALGYGNYRNANAMALGFFYQPKENVLFSIGGSMGNGENMVNAGISIALDKGFSNTKAQLTRKVQYLQAQNEEILQQNNAILAENAAIKEQNAKLEARLAAIEAKLAKQ